MASKAYRGKTCAYCATPRAGNNLGAGTFAYEGRQAIDDPRLTLWKMSFYGAAVGEAGGARNRTALVYAFTAPKSMPAAEAMARLMGAVVDAPLQEEKVT